MKTIYISPRHDSDYNNLVKLRVPNHYTEDEARADYFAEKFKEWCDLPLDKEPQRVTDSVARFFARVKLMSSTNVVEIESRIKLAARLGISRNSVVYYLATLRDAGLAETKFFKNKTVTGYYLKY